MLTVMTVNVLISQKLNLKDYKWNNRVVLVMANEVNLKYSQQVKEITNESIQNLLERQIILIEIQNNSYSIFDPKSGEIGERNWKPTEDIFEKYLDKKDDFRFVLLGLDGGVKVDNTEVVTTKELFRKIDSMPMRRAEMRDR